MKHIGKYAKSVCLVIICLALVITSFGCNNAEYNDGSIGEDQLTDDGKLKVEGTVKVTCPQDVYPSDINRVSIRQWIKNFKSKYPEVTVVEDFSDRGNWSARISAKDMGDVFWLDDTQVYDMAITNKSLMPLDSYAEYFETKEPSFGFKRSDVFTGIYKLGEADGRVYMVPTNCGQNTFTYNKTILSDVGIGTVSDDWTWEDFRAAISKVYHTAGDGSVDRVGAAMRVYLSPMYVPFYLGFGGQWCDTVNKRVSLVTDENVINGVNELVTALQKKWIYPEYSRMYGIEFNEEYMYAFMNMNDDLLAANAGFWQLGSLVSLSSRAKIYEHAGVDWDIVAFPQFDYPATPCGSFGFGVFNYTSNPVAAAALVLSIYTQDGQRAINADAGGVPLLNSLKNETFWHLKDYPDKNYSAFVANTDQYVNSQVRCQVPAAVADIIEDGMLQLIKDLYAGELSIEERLTMIEMKANEKWVTIR